VNHFLQVGVLNIFLKGELRTMFKNNRYVFTIFGILVLLVAGACSQATQIPNAGAIATQIPPQVLEQAQQALVNQLGVSVENVQVQSAEQIDWPDACLGVPSDGEACAQVVTPGFRIDVQVNGQQYEVRTDQTGNTVKIVTPTPSAG
jgi:hypothetical protein